MKHSPFFIILLPGSLALSQTKVVIVVLLILTLKKKRPETKKGPKCKKTLL